MNAQTVSTTWLGEQLKQARGDANLTLDGLAAIVGTSRHHLIRLEKGTHVPRPNMLERIASATGKPLDYFVPAEVGTDGKSFRDARR